MGVTLDPYEVVEITLEHRKDPTTDVDTSTTTTTENLFILPETTIAPVSNGDLKLASSQFAATSELSANLWSAPVVVATKTSGSENDILVGTNGDDQLDAGAGNDVYTGGAGNDTFIFQNAIAGQVDRVTDFVIGQDKLALGDVPVGTNLGQLHDFDVDQTWQGASINYEGYSIIWEGVNATDLSMSDFIFV